jgi:hypothetical protein
MLHPDYQYNPKLIPSMAYLIAKDVFQVVLGSRILGDRAMINGMPVYKYIANRILPGHRILLSGKNFRNIILVTGLFQKRF